MSAYDTVFREDGIWIRYYCEVPGDDDSAVWLEVEPRFRMLTPMKAERVAYAILGAVRKYYESSRGRT